MKSHFLFSLLVAFTLLTVPAWAWDQKGHRVVAAVAWDHMDDDTRTKAVGLLRGASGDSDLLAEDAGAELPQAARDRELFLRAATWPDIVRATNHPARRRKYHQGPWHYVNIFWQERNRKAYERKDLGMNGDHLVGDGHPPLHTSARVAAFTPKGDHGGNDFCLGKAHPLGPHDCPVNLHALWDDILVSKRGPESVDAVAADLQQRYGKPLFHRAGQLRRLGARELQDRRDESVSGDALPTE